MFSLLVVITSLVVAVGQPLGLSEEQVEWLRQSLIPLESVDPAAPLQDLTFLDGFVADARIVALGEATHGSSEFFSVKHRMVRYLAENHGFSLFAIEASLPDSYRINSYVLTGEGNPRELVAGIFDVWNTHEVLELIEWMRDFNRQGKGQIQFVGFDMQKPWSSAEEILAFFQKHDLAYATFAESLLAFTKRLESAAEAPSVWSVWGKAAPELRNSAQELLSHLEQNRTEYLETVSRHEFDWVHLNARLLLQAAERFYGTSRDSSMAANVEWILDSNPGARIVLWAHNAHIAERGFNSPDHTPMGEVLANSYGDAYRSIGFAFARGANQSKDESGATISQLPVINGTVGGNLHRLGMPLFFLDLRQLEGEDAQWLGEPQFMRNFGPRPTSTGLRTVTPAASFDALLFVDVISRSRPLDSSDWR